MAELFEITLRDPYAHMVSQLFARGWADGYEQALSDARHAITGTYRDDADAVAILDDLWHRKSYTQRCDDAIAHTTETASASEAQMIVAMAKIGSLLGPIQTRKEGFVDGHE